LNNHFKRIVNHRVRMNSIPPVILRSSGRHTATLIFLHGLGDTGFGWAGALNTIKPPYLKVICPTAPIIPVTLNGGASMPAWYDILSLEEGDKREDMEGVNTAVEELHGMIRAEVDNAGIASSRVMVGGFSQGGAVSLSATLSHPTPLAGCLALSCYLPGMDRTVDRKMSDTPVWQAHGDSDSMVPYSRGRLTAGILQKLVKEHHFKTYEGMDHEAWPQEMEDMKVFIEQKLK